MQSVAGKVRKPIMKAEGTLGKAEEQVETTQPELVQEQGAGLQEPELIDTKPRATGAPEQFVPDAKVVDVKKGCATASPAKRATSTTFIMGPNIAQTKHHLVG